MTNQERQFEAWLKEAQMNFNYCLMCPDCQVKVISRTTRSRKGHYTFELKQCGKHKGDEFPLTRFEVEQRLFVLNKIREIVPPAYVLTSNVTMDEVQGRNAYRYEVVKLLEGLEKELKGQSYAI